MPITPERAREIRELREGIEQFKRNERDLFAAFADAIFLGDMKITSFTWDETPIPSTFTDDQAFLQAVGICPDQEL